MYQIQSNNLPKLIKEIKSKVYPLISFKQRHNAVYKPDQILDTLTYIAMTNDFTTNGCKTLKMLKPCPHQNTIWYNIKKLSVDEIKQQFEVAFDRILRDAKRRRMFTKLVDIAIDVTDWLFYGDENTPMVCRTKHKNGTNKAYKFATLNIVEAGKRFTLAVVPLSPFDLLEQVLERLIQIAKSKIKIRLAYMDRAFFNVACISKLEELGIRYLIPAIQNERIRRIVEGSEAGTVVRYKMMSTSRRKGLLKKCVEFNLLIVRSNKDESKKVTFATNVEVNERYVQEFCDNYSKRWGIETSYRVKEGFRIKTTSRDFRVRLFFFLFSVCLYNLWVFVNAIASLLLGISSGRLLITAKMFGVLVYTFQIDYG